MKNYNEEVEELESIESDILRIHKPIAIIPEVLNSTSDTNRRLNK